MLRRITDEQEATTVGLRQIDQPFQVTAGQQAIFIDDKKLTFHASLHRGIDQQPLNCVGAGQSSGCSRATKVLLLNPVAL